MHPAAQTLADAIREAGAIPVFFQTWGRKDGDKDNVSDDTYIAMQERLIQGYGMAAKQAGGAWVVPVGEVWSLVRGEGKGQELLYAEDGSHPAAGGTYLAACVFYTTLYDADIKKPSSKVPSAAALAKAAATARLKPLPYPHRPE